jgi:hypothetical protein
MSQEKFIERQACRALVAEGCMCPKVGFDGWPDRLVVYAPGKHMWMEFKAPGGKLTKAQKVRIPLLVAKGEMVWIVTNTAQAVELVRSTRTP